jgi:hypothetical protein
MKDNEQDALAGKADAVLNTHPPLLKTVFQDKTELDRLYPKGSDDKSVGATSPACRVSEISWGLFDDVSAPESFLAELDRMRHDIQRSKTMNDAEGILGQTYGLTKALELLGVDKTISLAIFHRMQFHVERRRIDLSLEDRPQV